jgi:general secretion pathway protein G
MRVVLLVVGVVAFFGAVGAGERRAAGVRQTRARLLAVHRAVDGYLAEHEGTCPPSLSAVAPYGRFAGVPRDAWGRPFRLRCPGPQDDAPYELMSDGPDGIPGGLDRIE